MFDLDSFISAYRQVQQLGFTESRRTGNTGIGKTLEDIMNIPENNIDAPDLHGIELKSQRALSSSYVTLFTKAPTKPKAVNTQLRLKYGTPDIEFSDIKVLHVSIFADRFVKHSGGYSFKLQLNDSEQKIFLLVKHNENGQIVEDSIYWTYEIIERNITTKLKHLAFVKAEVQKCENRELFNFKDCTVFTNSDFRRFLNELKCGNIMFDIRIGAYKTGQKRGKTHDHGSCFRIKRDNLKNLYESEHLLVE
jgi:hypothetical protein